MALLSLSGSGSLALAVNLSLSSFGWTQALAVKLALTVADKTNKMAPTLINTATRFLSETYLSILNSIFVVQSALQICHATLLLLSIFYFYYVQIAASLLLISRDVIPVAILLPYVPCPIYVFLIRFYHI